MGFSVLLIDDDPEWLVFLGRLLDRAGFHVVPLSDSNKLPQILERRPLPDLVVSDVLMPGATGSTVYQQVREMLGATTPVIICSSTSMKLKVDDILLSHVQKSNSATELVVEARRLLSLRPSALLTNDPDLDLDVDLDLPAAPSEGSNV